MTSELSLIGNNYVRYPVHLNEKENSMIATNSTNLRAHMKEYFDRVTDGYETLVVTRSNDANVVVMSQTEYNSLMETLYLIGDKANYDHLMRSIAQFKSGEFKEREELG